MGRLISALDLEGIELPINDSIDAFVMYVNNEEKKEAIKLCQELRMNGFKVETEYTSRALKGQFKQADRLNSKLLIILNSEDLKNNEVKIKNNVTKKEDIINLDYLIYYMDEQLNEMMYEDGDDCDCGCHHEHDHECSCGDDCDC